VVAGEAAAEPSARAEVDLGKRLLEYYDTFMAKETRFLRNTWNGKLSEQACEDVAQEAFMRVARKVAAAQLEPGVKIGAYLRTTSWNLSLDTLRAQKRTDLMDDTALVAAPNPESEDVDPLKEHVSWSPSGSSGAQVAPSPTRRSTPPRSPPKNGNLRNCPQRHRVRPALEGRHAFQTQLANSNAQWPPDVPSHDSVTEHVRWRTSPTAALSRCPGVADNQVTLKTASHSVTVQAGCPL